MTNAQSPLGLLAGREGDEMDNMERSKAEVVPSEVVPYGDAE